MIHENVLAALAAQACAAETRPRHWLVVGGAPRSGTTALGRALDRSAGISLFHEYASHTFFDALNTLFVEEARHRGFADFNPGDIMPLAGRDAAAIAGDIFARVTGKRTPVIGTKFPGHQLWPRRTLPPGLGSKEIMVVRNPLETVISSIEKAVHDEGRIEASYAADVAQHHWAHAWNHALLYEGDALLRVALDDVAADPEREAARIAHFLEIPNDLDLSEMRAASEQHDVEGRYRRLGLTGLHDELLKRWSPRPWGEQVAEAAAQRLFHGVPLRGSAIDFTETGDHWKYVQHGFHPAEPLGSWTADADAMIVFRLPDPEPGEYQLTLNLGWAPRIGGQTTRIEVVVDDQITEEGIVDLGEHLDQRHTITLRLANFTPRPAGTCLRIHTHNPRSPAATGEAADVRTLGFMLHSLRFERMLASSSA